MTHDGTPRTAGGMTTETVELDRGDAGKVRGALAVPSGEDVEGLSAVLPFYGTPRDEFLHDDRMLRRHLG